MDILNNIEEWKELFEKYPVSEIRSLNVQLSELADSKQQELRHLVGNRYKEMLKTADIIISMNDLVAQEDAALSELVTKEFHTLWYKHEKSYMDFYNSIIPSDACHNTPFTPKDSFTNAIPAIMSPSGFANREQYLQNQSILQLTEATISFIKRCMNHQNLYILDDSQPHNFLRVARGLRLAELLLNEPNMLKHDIAVFGSVVSERNKNAQLRLKLKELKQSFEKILNKLFLNGEANDILPFSSYITLFLAYSHFKHLNPNQVLEKLLESRLAFIDQKFDEFLSDSEADNSKLITFFPETLCLLSSTYSLAYKSFSKNSIPITISKQHSVYSLLDTPELHEDIQLNLAKYKKWLPESIKNERAFPEACKENIISTSRSSTKTTQYLTTQIEAFSNKVIKVLSKKVPQLISSIDSLESLVTLYKKVLEVSRDNSSIRKLGGKIEIEQGNKHVSFYHEIFVNTWTAEFKKLIESRICDLLNQENALRILHSDILSSKKNQLSPEASLSEMYDSIFSADFASLISLTRGYQNATNLFTVLDDFSTGSVGSISSVAHEYKVWLDRISSIKIHVADFGKLKSLLSLTYSISDGSNNNSAGIDDDEDDNFADEWRASEKSNIDKIHQLFNDQIQKTLQDVHDDMLREVDDLFEKNKKVGIKPDDQIRGTVLLIRSILLFEWYFDSMRGSSGSDLGIENASATTSAFPTSSSLESTKTNGKKEAKQAEIIVEKIFNYLAELVASQMPRINPLFYRHSDTELWTSAAQQTNLLESGKPNASKSEAENGISSNQTNVWPDVPSLAILKYLTDLVNNLLQYLGHDNLLWAHESGLLTLQQQIGSTIFGYLEENYQTVISNYQNEAKTLENDCSKGDKGSEDTAAEKSEEPAKDDEAQTEGYGKESDEQKEAEQQKETKLETDTITGSTFSSQTTNSILQLYADFYYVSQLLNTPAPKSYSLSSLDSNLGISDGKNENEAQLNAHVQKVLKENGENIKNAIKAVVGKTRVVYLPLAA